MTPAAIHSPFPGELALAAVLVLLFVLMVMPLALVFALAHRIRKGLRR